MNMHANDIVFIVGAGISKAFPSNVPLGKDLTEFIMQESCGKKESSCIFDLWDRFSKEIYHYDKNLKFSILRLETILGCIQEIDQLTNRNSIMNGLKSFSNIPYNMNHKIIAEFLSQGSNIITTNFDLGIENAYEAKWGELKYESYKGFSKFSSNGTGNIYHIHGCSKDNIYKLGATVEMVKQGFTLEVESQLENIIKKSKVIVFLGYSVSDSFDVTPYFENINYNIEKAVFVQHKIENAKNEYPSNLSIINKNISKCKKLIEDTTKYLKCLSKEVLNIDYDLLNNEDVFKTKEFEWKIAFQNSWGKPYNSDEKLMNLLGIRYQVGFNTKILTTVRPNIFNEIELHQIHYNYNHYRLKEYYSEALRSFDIFKEEKIIKPTSTISNVVNYIDKKHLNKLANECKYYYLKYRNTSKTIEKDDLKRINKLINILELYSNYSFNQVQYISYIIAALKYLALFKSRFQLCYTPEVCRKELLLSLDISYIEGTIAALTHYSEHCIYLRELTGNEKYDSKINNALSTAYKLSQLSGYYYHCIIIGNLIYNKKYIEF